MPPEFNRPVQWVQRKSENPSAFWRYGFAVVVVLAATAVRLAFNRIVGVYAPTVLFGLAVIAAAWFGGRGPGLAATALSALGGVWFFIQPAYSFHFEHPEDIWALALFVFEGALIALLVGSLRESLLARVRAEDIAHRQAHLIDLSHDAVITMDSHRHVITWNKGAAEMYGWSERDALGKVWHELLQTAGDTSISEIDRILHREGRWQGELNNTARDGHRLFVDTRQVLYKGGTHSPSSILAISRDITRRKEMEEDLRESEEQFRTLANTMANLSGMTYPDGMAFWLNQRWSDYTGLTLEQSEGEGWLSAIDREASPGVVERWEHSIATGEPLESVFAVRGADGISRPFLCRAVPLRDSAGWVVRWFGTMTDISEQRRTEEDLRKAHGELQAIMDAMPVSLLISRDPECRFVLGNRRTYEVLRQPPGGNLAEFEDEQRPAFRLIENGTEIPRSESPLDKAAATGQAVYNRELEVIFPDGSRASIISNAVPLLDSEGRSTGAVATFWDITERKRAEERLRENEEHLRLAQQVARLGTFEWNIQTGVDRWTPELEALHGLPPGGFAGTFQAWEELVHPADRAEAVHRVQQALDTGETWDAEYRVIHPDGSVRWLLGRSRVFKDDSGNPQELIGVNMDITERKQAEESLRKSEERLRLAQQVARLAAFEWDIQTGVLRFPPELEALYGLPPGGFAETFQAWQEQVHPADRAEALRRVQQALDTGETCDAEYRVIQPNGSVRWILAWARLFKDDSGKPQRLIGVNMDITERKQAEEHVRESEERLRMAQEVARISTFEWDIQTGVARFPPELEALYGLPSGGFAGTFQAWKELIHPEDRVEALRRVQQALDTGATCEAEYRVIQPDGSVRWIFARGRLIKDDSGKPHRMIGVNMDITERKEAEERLRDSEARLQFVLEAANLGAWERDIADNKVVWRAGHYDALFGYQAPLPEWTWETFLDHVVPEDREELDRQFRDFEAAGADRQWQHEFRIRRADGEVRWMWTEGRARRGEDGRAVRVYGVKQDITERKQAEEYLRNAQKLESIGLLAGGIAHDFNNLLTVIMGGADCALREHPDSENIQHILTASREAAHLTRQLLAYAGRGLFLTKKTFNLGDLVSRSMELLSASVPKRVSLKFNQPADELLIEADPSQIEQIVMNLVINAGEAIPPYSDGEIEISLSLSDVTPEMFLHQGKEHKVKPGRFVCLGIVDNGIGMNESTLAKVFDPFFSTKFTGRGLGLAAVQGIVRSCGGFIDAQSSPGAGSAFKVFLPAAGKTVSMELPIRSQPGTSEGEDRTKRSSG